MSDGRLTLSQVPFTLCRYKKNAVGNFAALFFKEITVYALPVEPGGGVHDLRMDGGQPPGFQKATHFLLPTAAVIPTFMMNFCGKLPILDNFFHFLENPPMFMENLQKKRPLFKEFWAQKPTHMGGTYPYPQHAMLPPPPAGRTPCAE